METDVQDMVLLPAVRRLERRAGFGRADAPVEEKIDRAVVQPQGYRISIAPKICRIVARDPAGIFYARQTLEQIRRQFPEAMPCLEIEDSPDFPVRGVMLDISRSKVPTMQTLFDLVDRLAQWKVNHLQLYIEHTFAYRGHEEVWRDASPITAEEIRQLDAFCKERFIELAANQNSFGHMERWLRHPRYLPLAEAPDGSETPWDFRWEGPFSLCPTDPRSLELLDDLYSQLLPNFSSRLFNVGCDETFDIGQGRSAEEVRRRGVHQVYVDFVNQVAELTARHGRRMLFWGDIILHEPQLIGQLPKNAIALDWGYEAEHPFDAETRQFKDSGMAFYVCPGTSSWTSIAGRTDNMLANQRAAATAGLAHGASGYLNTDWGDHGHLQYLPISYAGFAAGAAISWCLESNRGLPLARVLDIHAFEDEAGVMGTLACELGNVYKASGKPIHNRSPLFNILVPSSTHEDPMEDVTREDLDAFMAAIDKAMGPLLSSRMRRADAKLIQDEFSNAAAMLKYACLKGRGDDAGELLEGIVKGHRVCWLARNRPGGMEEGIGKIRNSKSE
jgi:hexosaminidase